MPSSFSRALRLELVADGEQAGLWGQTTNNNIGALLEQAITGTTDINVTSGGATLTALNAVVDQARSAVLRVFGTPPVPRTVVIPNVPKTYWVINETEQTLEFRTPSGTGYTCPALSQSFIVCDGVGVGEIAGLSITEAVRPLLMSQSLEASLAAYGFAPINSPAFTGIPLAPTPAVTSSNNQIATTKYVVDRLLVERNSPIFTGKPTAPTAPVGTNTDQIATTAFVQASVTAAKDGTIPPGAVMLFQQTSAPTGWTKQTTHNDKALRVVSGIASSGGSRTFSSVFINTTVGETALTLDQIPAHTHSGSTNTTSAGSHSHTISGATSSAGAHSHLYGKLGTAYGYTRVSMGSGESYSDTPTSSAGAHTHTISGTTGSASASHNHTVTLNNAGGGKAHTHTLQMDVAYVDVIIAIKNAD